MTDWLKRLNDRLDLTISIPVTSSILLILFAAKILWDHPTRFILLIGLTFLATSAIYWLVQPWGRHLYTVGAVAPKVGSLLIIWLVGTAMILGAIYRIDNAGWLWFQSTGYYVTLAEEYPDRVNVNLEEFLLFYPFFALDAEDETKLVLKKGVYDIKDTVVIPKGTSLTIESGAKLQFRAGRSLISYSPIIAEGTPDAPILFSAKNRLLKWGAVGLVGTGPSLFAHVIFENGRQSFINELDFLGALSLINSDALIRDSQFTNLYGKDGVYVREGRVVVQNNLFKDTYKDCLDFNSGEGEITNNQFINCGDEGIDLSQNIDVQVFDNLVLDPQGGFIDADFNLEEIQALNSLGFSEDD